MPLSPLQFLEVVWKTYGPFNDDPLSDEPFGVIDKSIWLMSDPSGSKRFNVAVSPLITPVMVAVVRYVQKEDVGLVALIVPESVVVLPPTFGPCARVPCTLIGGISGSDGVNVPVKTPLRGGTITPDHVPVEV